ncbi:transmembrane sensor [Agrobacterium vitis]|nr:transmembrane sensor [Agrobacterium vitis]MBE1440207.1 transmembrane sensor [Agrobacterium vitis]
MRSDDCPPPNKALIEKEAIAWFTRISGHPSAADRRDFELWLGKSDLHKQVYDDVRGLWSQLASVAEVIGEQQGADLAGPLDVIRKERSRRRTAKLGSALACCLAVIVAGGWMWLEKPGVWQDMAADFVTARGERKSLTLSDGSMIELDADSAVEIDVSPTRRHVHLLRGSAFFQVIPSALPFTVEAGMGETRVLGTEFEVSMLTEDQVETNLIKGSVSVRLRDDTDERRLQPGQGVMYDGIKLGAVHSVNLDDALAWRRGRLIFTNARLEDVVAQIGRYFDGRIVLTSSSLADTVVSGNIALDDPDKALAAIQSSIGFKMIKIAGKLILIGP